MFTHRKSALHSSPFPLPERIPAPRPSLLFPSLLSPLQFFPHIYARTVSGENDHDPWCIYNNHHLQLFSSCMFLAGAVAAPLAGHVTRALGRKVIWICGGGAARPDASSHGVLRCCSRRALWVFSMQ